MKIISPSGLTTRISLQAPTKVPDGAGGFVVTWVTIANEWAKKTTLRSDEAIVAMQTTGTAIHNFVIRYRTDVKSSWRIKEGNKYYNIIGPPIDIDARKEWLDIKAKETT